MRFNKTSSDWIDTFRERCSTLGLKVTHQRLMIYNVLSSTEGHPSSEEIYKQVRRKLPTISFDTVYRTLALFEQHGLITRIRQIDDRTRYDSNMNQHCHIVCTRCNKVQDLCWLEIDLLAVPSETAEWGLLSSIDTWSYGESARIARKRGNKNSQCLRYIGV